MFDSVNKWRILGAVGKVKSVRAKLGFCGILRIAFNLTANKDTHAQQQNVDVVSAQGEVGQWMGQ
ncbi:MAG: hypothetical protein OXF74_06430 [Rhodobacteraceae bacterium]|nr:hypothetical protein [Paracoccaceae bacterium]